MQFRQRACYHVYKVQPTPFGFSSCDTLNFGQDLGAGKKHAIGGGAGPRQIVAQGHSCPHGHVELYHNRPRFGKRRVLFYHTESPVTAVDTLASPRRAAPRNREDAIEELIMLPVQPTTVDCMVSRAWVRSAKPGFALPRPASVAQAYGCAPHQR